MKTILFSTLIILSLFSCKTKKGTTQTTKLEDSSWVVTHLGEKESSVKQTLVIEGDGVKGKGACNGFGGQLKLGENQVITISAIVATKMGCDQLSEEVKYFNKLQEAKTYSINKGELVLYNSDKKSLVKFKKMQ
ncbi:MAG: META domain-containing protein [Flavobacteriales bacterium]|jgi:heat shock protein HslJ|nr:META domain-containing protein [Flavobacteriales bacterium]